MFHQSTSLIMKLNNYILLISQGFGLLYTWIIDLSMQQHVWKNKAYFSVSIKTTENSISTPSYILHISQQSSVLPISMLKNEKHFSHLALNYFCIYKGKWQYILFPCALTSDTSTALLSQRKWDSFSSLTHSCSKAVLYLQGIALKGNLPFHQCNFSTEISCKYSTPTRDL